MIISIVSCKKYLEAPSDKRLVIIKTVSDLQGLLDATNQINFNDPGVGEVSADNCYINSDIWDALDEYDRAQYTWANYDVIPPFSVYEMNVWSNCYNVIYRANTVLFNLENIMRTPENSLDYDNLKGQAFFLRGKFFLESAWLWCLAYDEQSSDTDLGLPLRLSPDFNEVSIRSTLEQTYQQIISDLKMSIDLLPAKSMHPVRPSKAGAYGYLSRCYLSMRNYEYAEAYADSCLQINSDLLDYNIDIPDIGDYFPIPEFNKEIIYYSSMFTPRAIYYGGIDTILYRSFGDEDWRKQIFFLDNGDDYISFRGNYTQNGAPFTGLATDELYLTRAECRVRNGNVVNGVDDLNILLKNRFASTSFVPLSITDSQIALDTILAERRKELIYRELRWMDVKRLNKEGRNITLKKSVNGVGYNLPPNDLRFAVAIPEDIIARSGMQQNPR